MLHGLQYYQTLVVRAVYKLFVNICMALLAWDLVSCCIYAIPVVLTHKE